MRRRIQLIARILAACLVVGLGGLAVALGTGMIAPFANIVGAQTETRSSQVIEAVRSEEQIVLLSLGIQGIEEKDSRTTFFDVDIPGSERSAFLRYEFRAKLGIEGGDVEVQLQDGGQYVVSIPEFIFIGHQFVSEDGEPFKMVVESGGALSWVTPEIDETDMINKILSADKRDEYVELNRDDLEDSARNFYEGIIRSIEPEADVVVEYR